MTIENDLQRIADALEIIAETLSTTPSVKFAAIAEPVKTEPVKTEPVKTEPVKTEPVKTEPVKTEPVKTEPVKTEPESKGVTWKDLREYFIGTLNIVREKTGSHDDARTVGLNLLKQYAAGNAMKEENIPPESYEVFYTSLTNLREKYNG